jgi:hypothetical protein
MTSSQTPILHGGSTTTQTPTRTTTLGLPLREGLTYHEWLDIGTRLTRNARTLPWMIGDWARYGEWRYGERYDQAIQITGLDIGTLKNYASVAGRFQTSRRNDLLTLSHHALVQKMTDDEQDLWLGRAAENGWTVAELRNQLKALKDEPNAKVAAAVVHLLIGAERQNRWQRAAERDGYQNVDEWAVATLDQASMQLEAA